MSAHLILSADWTSYDDFKTSIGQNPDIFLPNDTWEANYLIRLIGGFYQQYTEMAILLSIEKVKRSIYAGCNRKLFVELVLENLTKRKPFIEMITEPC